MMIIVVKQDGYAVGRRYPDTNTFLVSHHSVYALQQLFTFFTGQRKVIPTYLPYFHTVHLMGQEDMVWRNAKPIRQQFAILLDMPSIVTTIFIDIELAILSLAYPSLSGRRKSYDSISNTIFHEC